MLIPARLLYRHHQAWQSTLQLHERCKALSVPITKDAYALLFVARSHTRQWQDVLPLLDDAESTLRPHTPLVQLPPIYNSAIHALGTSTHPDLALDVYQRMPTAGLPTTQETFTAILNAMAQPAHGSTRISLQTVQQLHEGVVAAGMALNSRCTAR